MFSMKRKSLWLASILAISLAFTGCSNDSKKSETVKSERESSVDDVIDVEYTEYAGEYQDSFSQRAVMTAEDLGDALKLTVHWSGSATEASIWTMTARLTDSDKLSYTDCEYGVIVFDDDGNDSYTKEYDSGEGYFTLADGKLLWDGAADESCKDCVFEKMNFESSSDGTIEGKEIWYVEENVDIENLADGTYPVKVLFDGMKRSENSLSLDFMIYTPVRYDADDINNLKRGDIIYEYVDEVTTNNYVIDTVNFPIDEVCVINGGSERGEGLTLSKYESGFFLVTIDEIYTRNASHGVATLDISDNVVFEDNHDLSDSKLSGKQLYDYFEGLSDTEKEYFNENNTFIKVSGGEIVEFCRIYLP